MKVTHSALGDFILSHDSYSPALVASARAIPGVNKVSSTVITGSADAIDASIKYLITERGLRESAFEGRDILPPNPETLISRHQWPSTWPPVNDRLRAYQREAIWFLRQNKRAILADDMGLGKTASAINAAISFTTQKRVLIVCPSYVRGVWYNDHDGGELMKWAAEEADTTEGHMRYAPHVYKCAGVKPPPGMLDPDCPFIICHYDILHAWADKLAEWGPEIVIYDECHYLMNSETKRTKAAKQVSAHAEYVWGLSGTPMTNRPRDLWGILDTIVPGRFGDNFFPFGLRYCGGYKEAVTPEKTVWKFDSKSNLDELRARLQHFMLRRTKTDVALELPPKTRQCIRVDVGKHGQNGAAVMYAEHPNKGNNLRGALAVAADAKLKDSAVPLIAEHVAAGAKVVVFTYRRAVAEYIANEHGGALLHGGISQANREKTLHHLRHLEGASVLCATIDAASTGIDLSYADVAVFVELTYEPHELLQAEARLHRFGAKNPVLIQYLIARGTTDELVAEVVLNKLDSLESAIGGFAETGMSVDMREDADSIMADLYKRLGL